MVWPGGTVLDGRHRLSSHPGPVGQLCLAEADFGSALGQEPTRAVEFGEHFGEGLVSAGVERGLLVEPGVTLHEHGGRAGAGCGASSHHACAA